MINYYQSDKAQRSALKALLITHIGSLGLYLAAATLFLQTGTCVLSAMSELHGDARYLVYGGILFAAWGNRPSYRCKRGYRMQWKRQHRSVPISTPHRR
ncbi:proton-conducting transporter membrane subunit [Escherichia coli]|nr:proton-conducting transporter membrane subunit [Escherichia coli]